MKKDFVEHPIDFVLFFGYAGFSFLLLVLFHTPIQRLSVATTFALYYFVWALLHHTRIKKITLNVVLEYLLITILGFVTLQVIFFPTL